MVVAGSIAGEFTSRGGRAQSSAEMRRSPAAQGEPTRPVQEQFAVQEGPGPLAASWRRGFDDAKCLARCGHSRPGAAPQAVRDSLRVHERKKPAVRAAQSCLVQPPYLPGVTPTLRLNISTNALTLL